MNDEKKTINVDGLSDRSIEEFREGVDACRNGKDVWILGDEAYNERVKKSFYNGSIATYITMSILSACAAIYIANEDKIRDGLSKAMKFIFGKKK